MCTGIAASWCPICGDCSCPHNEDGEIIWHYERGEVSIHGFRGFSDTARTVVHYDPNCPIHGTESAHADELLDG